MSAAPLAFDRDVSLAEMLRAVPRAALETAMAHSIGAAWRISAADGTSLREGPRPLDGAHCQAALVVDLDPVGMLSAPAAQAAAVDAAARWLELLLGASNRYRMAADLHIETVHADHRALVAKHEALMASEARYRSLNEQLEARVREQVAVIERSQRRMYLAERMASVGNLAAGMAHEINNPIGFIRSNLSSAKGYVATLAKAVGSQSWEPATAEDLAFVLDDFASLLDESVGGADRIGRIIEDLKTYASSGTARMALADPGVALHGAVRLLGELPAGLRLEQDLPALPVCACDSAGLQRAVLAMLLNARRAMQGRAGVIRIGAAMREGTLAITIADQGCGIDPAIRERIFDPFFTTHDVGGGAGLGLTVASDVVRAHHGSIELDSVPGQGSCFTVLIPLHANAPDGTSP